MQLMTRLLVWQFVVSFALSLSPKTAEFSRRNVIESLTTAGVFLSPLSAQADSTVPRTKGILVLGANGKTGRECVKYSLMSGRKCIASSRTGSFVDADSYQTNKLSTAAVDVSSLDSVQKATKNANLGAVIFAASVSNGGKREDSFAVDKDGVVNAAKCCLEYKIPRLVVVSSGCVTRPDSAVYKLLNFVGSGIMEAKIQGEDIVRQLYLSSTAADQGLGYTVIRPGGLTMDEAKGAEAIELNQGDTKSGRLSRADVAALCIECLDSPSTFDTTFECYEKATAKPVESVGLSNIFKSTDPTTVMLGKERQGSTYAALFDGLSVDSA